MMTKFLGTLCIIALLFGIVAYASGWIEFRSGENSTTIEMNTGEMKDSADKAIRKGKDLLEKAGDSFKQDDDGQQPVPQEPLSDKSG